MTSSVLPPIFQLQIGNYTFSSEVVRKRVISIEIELIANSVDSCKIELDDFDGLFTNKDKKGEHWKLVEQDSITIGLALKGPVKTLFTGTVHGLGVSRREGSRNIFTVTGYNNLSRLTRNRKRRCWERITDSELAGVIADDNGLACNADGTKIIHEYVAQNNETDLAFLQSRAKRNGYELNCTGNTLNFQIPKVKRSCCVLSYKPVGDDTTVLRKARFKSSTAGQAESVTVRGYDPKTKKEIIGVSGETYGGVMSGLKTAASLSPANRIQINEIPVESAEDAERIARSVLNERAMNFMTGIGQCQGNPEIIPSHIVTVKEVGEEIDGDYYVAEARHVFRSGDERNFGYVTDFIIQRSGR